jgi:hypothetical protein
LLRGDSYFSFQYTDARKIRIASLRPSNAVMAFSGHQPV